MRFNPPHSASAGRDNSATSMQDESIVSLAIVLASTLLVTATVLLTSGNIPAAVILIACMLLVGVTFVRLDWSFYVFTGMVLAFDQHEIPGFFPFTFSVQFFKNLKENNFLPSIDFAVFNPMELHLLLLIFMWFVVLFVKRPAVQGPAAWGAAVIFLLWIVGGFIIGMKSGGDFLPALWEVRALFYLAIVYFFVPQIIQTREQVETLFAVIIAAIAFKALQGVARFASLGFSLSGFATLTNHEDPVFITTLVVMLMGLVVFKSQHRHRTLLMTLLPLLMLGFFVAQRRAAYAAAAISIITFIVLMSPRERYTMVRSILPVIGFFVIYCTVFWESESRWASPVRLVKSGLSNDKETSGERYYSNLYREFEKYDLAVTVQKAPLAGIGFGKKYERPIPLADISFPLRDYIPHNEILWVMVKLGAFGFFAFALFFTVFAFRGAAVFRRLDDPYLKAICAVAVTAVINQLIVSYYDLQLTYYRNMVYLGIVMGLLPTLENLAREPWHNRVRYDEADAAAHPAV
jgi:hypothetical protein